MGNYDFDFSEAGYWLEPDFVLADIVATLVNAVGLSIGITLFMKGTVISGLLVSEDEYLHALSDMFNQVANPPQGEDVDNLFDFTGLKESTDMDGLFDSAADDDEINLLEDAPPIRHLHIRDVVVLSPQPSLVFGHSQMPIVRIRLTTIDGWMLGQAAIDDGNGSSDYLGNGGTSHVH